MKIQSFKNATEVAFIQYAPFNRKVENKRVSLMAQDILNGNSKFLPPIIVGETETGTFYVMDGQHRLAAMKLAWAKGSKQALNVIIEKCPYSELRNAIVRFHKRDTMKAWSNRDYAFSLKNSGNDAMIALYKFAENKADLWTKNELLRLRNLTCFIYGKTMDNEIRTGDITITPQEIELGETVYRDFHLMYKEIRKLGFKSNNWTEKFIKGWRLIRLNPELSAKLEEIGIETYAKKFLKASDFSKIYMITAYSVREWYEKHTSAILNLYQKKAS